MVEFIGILPRRRFDYGTSAVAHGLGSWAIVLISVSVTHHAPSVATVAYSLTARFAMAPTAFTSTTGAASVPLSRTTVVTSPRTMGVTIRSRPSVRRFTVPVMTALYLAVSVATLCSEVRMPFLIGTRAVKHLTSVLGSAFRNGFAGLNICCLLY